VVDRCGRRFAPGGRPAPPRAGTVGSGRVTGRNSTMTFVALLRGVNVGGNNMISMASLKADFQKAGFKQVSSYINSGNLLFQAAESDPRKLERKIEAMLSKKYQLASKVVVRSLPEMATLVQNLPRHWNDDKAWRYNVIFLRHTIDSEDILTALGFKPDVEQVVYRPGTLLWSAKVTDVTRTTMVKLSSKKIFQDMTVRNVNTTRKLYLLMKGMAEA
jgi:uncharacterized protein (DUF1697 family)